MNDTTTRPKKTILDDFLGRVCSVCAKPKQSEKSFCLLCFRKLPAEMFSGLYERFGQGYEQNFYKCRAWLENNKAAEARQVVKIKWPATSKSLTEAGYEYDNPGFCRECGAPIEWWITPLGRKMPIFVQKAENVLFDSGETRVAHFANCPRRDAFRRKA